MPSWDDYVILDRLRKMRQRQEETYVVYEARMNEQFNRLDTQLEESKKLKLLLGGLHLYYRSKIVSADVRTTKELRQACIRLEPDKAPLRRLEGEKDRCEKVEKGRPDKEDKYLGRTDRARRAFEVHEVQHPRKRKEEATMCAGGEEREETQGEPREEIEVEVAATAMGNRGAGGPFRGYVGAQRCWRCGEGGHISLSCKTEIFCISCGQQGVVAERCPRCAAAAAAGRWAHAAPYQTSVVPSFHAGAWNWGTQVPPRYATPIMDMPTTQSTLPQPMQPQRSHQWTSQPGETPTGATFPRATAPQGNSNQGTGFGRR